MSFTIQVLTEIYRLVVAVYGKTHSAAGSINPRDVAHSILVGLGTAAAFLTAASAFLTTASGYAATGAGVAAALLAALQKYTADAPTPSH